MKTTTLVGILFAFLISPNIYAHCKGPHQTDWPDDPKHDKCGDDSGGSDSGTDVKLVCQLSEGGGNNVLPDRAPPNEYVDGLEKVGCDTGGTSQPNLSGINLNSFDGGNATHAERKINFEFDFCTDNAFCIKSAIDTGGAALWKGNPVPYSGVTGLGDLMGLFRHNDPLKDNVLENAGISVRPYKPDNNAGAPINQGHIQLLPNGNYPMAVRLLLTDYGRDIPRVVISIAGHSVLGDKFQGTLCDIPDQGPATAGDAIVTVNKPGSDPRFVVSADTHGAICSNVPWDQDGDSKDESCGKGADASRVCNFHGLVKVKFKMDAYALE